MDSEQEQRLWTHFRLLLDQMSQLIKIQSVILETLVEMKTDKQAEQDQLASDMQRLRTANDS